MVINTADDEMIDDNINMIDCNFTEEVEEWKEMKNGDNVIVDLINWKNLNIFNYYNIMTDSIIDYEELKSEKKEKEALLLQN